MHQCFLSKQLHSASVTQTLFVEIVVYHLFIANKYFASCGVVELELGAGS